MYNPIPSYVLHDFLECMGFTKALAGGEVVYERINHNLPSLVVKVYTSAKKGSATVADRGKDAIRLVLVHRQQGEKDQPIRTRPKKKGEKGRASIRVFRTGTTESILNRVRDRARELYAAANWIRMTPPCKRCGAPCYRGSTLCVRFCQKH